MKTLPGNEVLFKPAFATEELYKIMQQTNLTEQAKRRRDVWQRLTLVLRLAMNERFALEEALTEQGMHEFSNALYSFEWKSMRDALDAEIAKRQQRGYWANVWCALRKRY